MWSSLLLSIFMMVVLPAPFFGAVIAAHHTEPAGTGTETEDHRGHDECADELQGVAARAQHPAPPRRSTPPIRIRIRAPRLAAQRLVDLYIPHPARFSERRLL